MPYPSPISCLSCGYSIAGLAPDSFCPECAYPIARSAAAHQIFGDSIANPLALSRLFRSLGALELAVALWLLTVITLSHLRPATFDRIETFAHISGLSLWLALSITWFRVTGAIVVRQSRKAFALLAFFRVASCILLLAASAFLLGSYTSRLPSFVIGPLGCVSLAALIEFCLIISTAVLIRDIIFALPNPGRLPLLNLAALLCFYIAVSAALASIRYPLLAFAVPFAPALASLRSFILSRRIRAAIGEH